MSDPFLHTDFLDNSQPPVPIPDPEVAWHDMRTRLERDLSTAPTSPKPTRWMLLFIFLSTGISILLVADNHQRKQRAVATTTFKDKTIFIEQNKKETKIETQIITNKTTATEANRIPAFSEATQPGFEENNQKLGSAIAFQSKATFSKVHTQQATRLRTKQKILKRKTHWFRKIDTINIVAYHTIRHLLSSEEISGVLPITHVDTIAIKKATANEPIQVATPFMQLRTGLQWAVPLPIANAASYFGGADGTLQPYAVLIPGVWLSLTADRSGFTVDVQPLAMALLKTKQFSTTKVQLDATTTRTTVQTLQKILGLSAGLQSQYNIRPKWWLGGSLQGNFWKKGIIHTHNIDQRQEGTNQTVIAETKTVSTASFKDPALTDFSKFQLFMNADLLYKTSRWETGLRIGATFERLAQRAGPAYQFQALLFLRLRLLQKNLH